MTRAVALLCCALALLLPGGGAFAQGVHVHGTSGARVVSTTSWVEEWDPATQQWVRVADTPASLSRASHESAATPLTMARTTAITRDGNSTITETVIEEQVRFIAARPRPGLPSSGPRSSGIANFGPFRVIDGQRAALVGPTDAASPQAFAAMIAAYPGLEVLEFLEAPGTSHDLANLRLGRAIRAAGLSTHVPAGGSARSGAVELFLAGTRRSVDAGAMFAVHSWRDELGREPADFAPDAPENRLYLDYYADMGMSADQARAFYAMTNSVPHAGARWMEGAEMATWIAPQDTAPGVPATRSLGPQFETALRAALARSGGVLAEAMRSAWRGPRTLAAAPLAVSGFAAGGTPGLAYAGAGAQTGAGLLDSWTAFP